MPVVSGVTEWLTEDGLTKLKAWARDGLTNDQIAHNIGLASTTTLYNWKKKHPEIEVALKRGKLVVDIQVENALFKKATGFYVTEQVVYMKRRVDYKEGKRLLEVSEPITIEIQKYFPPESTAIIYWLKNRKPANWRDKIYDQDNDEEIKNAKEILIKIRKIADE